MTKHGVYGSTFVDYTPCTITKVCMQQIWRDGGVSWKKPGVEHFAFFRSPSSTTYTHRLVHVFAFCKVSPAPKKLKI